LTLFSSGKTLAETLSPTYENSHLGSVELDPLYLDFEFDENITHRSSICKNFSKLKTLLASRSGGDEEDLFSFMGGMDGIDYSSHKDPKIFSQSYSPQTKSLSSPTSSLDPTHSSFKQENNFVEHPLGEHPSRTLFVRNISSLEIFFFTLLRYVGR
jgi:hypothetical protein